MSKKDYYNVEKNVNKIINSGSSYFLDPPTLLKVKSKLKGINYKTYSPFKDAERLIMYTDTIPTINVLEITSYDKLSHREIMGSLFASNYSYDMIGDIIITNEHYYLTILPDISNFIIKDLKMVGCHPVKLKEVDLSILDNYERKYEYKEIIVSSLRIDTIISRLINLSRDCSKEKFVNGDILLNYEIVNKPTTLLNVGDIFSIRKYGKYIFDSIKGFSKNNNYIIIVKKYID